MAHEPYTYGANGMDDYRTMPHPQTMILTVSQVETLAKAGVKVELAHQVMVQDDPPVRAWQQGDPDGLLELARNRWKVAMQAKHCEMMAGTMYVDPLRAAVKHGDKVHVFIAPGGAIEPSIIIDELCIFPSDALMAQLHIAVEHS